MSRSIYATIADLRAAGVELDLLGEVRAAGADLVIDAHGNVALVDGTEELRRRIVQRIERKAAALAEQRARDRRAWSEGLSLWIDLWSPYYIAPAQLLAGDEKLAGALRCLSAHPGVKVPRA